MKIIKVLALLFVLFLLGCGGDSTKTQAPRISVSLSTTSNTARPGKPVTITATVLNSTQGVDWTATGGALGDPVGDTVVWTAPQAVGEFKIRATSRENPRRWAETTVVVSQAVGVTITSPTPVTVLAGGQTTIRATAEGGVTNDLVWSVVGGGTLSATTGNEVAYTAPGAPMVVKVVATSADDPSKFAEATIDVRLVQVAVNPTAVTLQAGDSGAVVATVTGVDDDSVTWGATGGTLSATTGGTVTYTAPDAPGDYVVTVTSVADPTKSATVAVTVVPRVGITISPAFATILPGDTKVFRATVEGTANAAVEWSVGPDDGTLVPDGSSATYTAPTAAGTYTIRAKSVADPSKQAEVTITVPSPTAIALTPSSSTTEVNRSVTIAATVTGGHDRDVTWTVVTEPGFVSGTLSLTSGATTVFTAGTLTGHAKVRATSTADPSKTQDVVITVTPATGSLSGVIR